MQIDLLRSKYFADFISLFSIPRCKTAIFLTCDKIIELVSESAFNDSDEDSLSVGLVDSLSASQAAPITGLTASTTPLENLFHKGFLHASPWPSVSKSSKELTSTTMLDGDQSKQSSPPRSVTADHAGDSGTMTVTKSDSLRIT
ncbi:hypothetical protein HanXRQr2_Chr11g0500251 [Helianthus annuus]|uniref:Uncharacterized protein n=1 Tax=Helianthus annuus TaxID=4232 RepID=A0A9K3HQW7_HELAN|nr:hypothetical protein HanXRQr2_Chr11g0500251 [Helianthus annuus]KAJ0875896.1 hypothetical protein HanPSC8_Chr11g0481951 [Helianthus annuus]